ncbi:MAG: Ig-like domain-containing protein [Patescibacteria group bacterium]
MNLNQKKLSTIVIVIIVIVVIIIVGIIGYFVYFKKPTTPSITTPSTSIQPLSENQTTTLPSQTTPPPQTTLETESVKIISPASGTVVNAGTIINVKVQATGSVDRFFITGKEVCTKTALPFDFSCPVPAEIIGSYNIVAVGFGPNNITATDIIQLQVKTSAQLVGFRTYPPSMLIVIEGEKAGFQVLGEFSDFVRRDITSSANGTHYSITDTKIAVVVSDGVIQGKQAGETTLTISNSGLTATLPVYVESY